MYDLYVKIPCECPSLNLIIRGLEQYKNVQMRLNQIHMNLQPAHQIIKYLQIVMRLSWQITPDGHKSSVVCVHLYQGLTDLLIETDFQLVYSQANKASLLISLSLSLTHTHTHTHTTHTPHAHTSSVAENKKYV